MIISFQYLRWVVNDRRDRVERPVSLVRDERKRRRSRTAKDAFRWYGSARGFLAVSVSLLAPGSPRPAPLEGLAQATNIQTAIHRIIVVSLRFFYAAKPIVKSVRGNLIP
ncbi:MAG: hypothetical protein V1778_05340 [bacterium]